MASSRRRKRVIKIQERVNWKQWLLRIVFALIILVILSVVGAYFYLNAYLQGDEFRAIIENRAGKALKAEVQISPLSRDGKYILVKSLSVKDGQKVLKSGDASGVELQFDYGKLWNQEVYMDRVYIKEITVDIDIRKNQEAQAAEESHAGGPLSVREIGGAPLLAVAGEGQNATGKKEVASSWGKRFIPNKFGFSTIQIDNFSLNCAITQGMVRLSGTQINVSSKNEAAGSYKVGLKGGYYEIPGKLFPKGELDVASFRYSPDLFAISDLKVKLGKAGRLAVEGDVGMNRTPTDVNLSLQGVEMAEALPENWVRSLEGTLKATCKLRRDSEGDISANGELSLDKSVLTALPVLDTLAAFANTARFRRIDWTLAQSRFSYEDGNWSFKDIFLASEGLIRREGWVEIKGKALSGNLMVGIPAGLLSHIPGAEEVVFTKENNQGKMGLLWAPVTLGGTVDSPKEDLSRRLMTAAGERILRRLPGGKVILNFSQSFADRLLDGLNEGNKAPDASGDADKERDPNIKVGRDLLDTGLKMGFDLLNGSGKKEKGN